MADTKFGKVLSVIYAVIATLFLIMTVYAAFYTKNTIYTGDGGTNLTTIKQEDVDFETVENKNSKSGYEDIIKFKLNAGRGDSCLAVLVYNHEYEVYVDGILKYSVFTNNKSTIFKSPWTNWAFIRLTYENKNSDVEIRTYPAYKNVVTIFPQIFIGKEVSVYKKVMGAEMFPMTLSSVLIFIGIGYVLITIYHIKKGEQKLYQVYLGLFAILLGIWTLCSTDFFPMILPKISRFLGYVTFESLALLPVPMIMFSVSFLHSKIKFIPYFSVVFSLVLCLTSHVLQFFTKLDIRDMLPLIHISMIFGLITLVTITIESLIRYRGDVVQTIIAISVGLCVVSVIADLVFYYINKKSSHMLLTMISFLIFIFVTTVLSNIELNKNAYIDLATGLFNKSRCEQVLKSVPFEPVYVFMSDLNYLKDVNDKFGHDEGDRLIYSFADILKKSVPSNSFVGRFGGDEFISIIYTKDKKDIDEFILKLHKKVDDYNKIHTKVAISFSFGYASSAEFPNNSQIIDVFKSADAMMYENKKEFHKTHKRIYV